MSDLIYLAVPYSHKDPAIREARFKTVNKYAAKLMAEGKLVFSPISHTHPIALEGDLPLGWEYWSKFDHLMLKSCGRLIVLMIDGWLDSAGIKGEVDIARELGIPIEYAEVKE